MTYPLKKFKLLLTKIIKTMKLDKKKKKITEKYKRKTHLLQINNRDLLKTNIITFYGFNIVY